MKLYFLLVLQLVSCSSFPTKPRLTLDEFFDATTFKHLSLSPTGTHLLIETTRPSWNTNSYENILWIYDVQQQTRKLITKHSHKSIKPQWSPSGNWIALLLDDKSLNSTDGHPFQRSLENYPQSEQFIYLYSLISNDLLPIQIGKDILLAFTWSDHDFSLYLATLNLQAAIEDHELNEKEWKDVTRYRQTLKYQQSTIYRVDITEHNHLLSLKRNILRNIPSLITELLFAPLEGKLLYISASAIIEDLQALEIYSVDLRSTSLSLARLTHNEGFEINLQLSIDGRHVLFLATNTDSTRNVFNDTQSRLYSINLINGKITRLAAAFDGNIQEYIIKSDGGVYIVGLLGTEVQLYSQRSLSEDLIEHIGWNGTYELITLSKQDLIAFVHSSTEKPMEVYLTKNINQLQLAQVITDENKLFTQRELPRAKVYQWKNEEDHRRIEGMLHYPPGKYESKNLPLLVLIHGGPGAASVNRLSPDWYAWAALAASEGWLVLEPNYRGSTGYGDQFYSEILYRPVSLPGKDILYGVDQLIRDGIVDPYRLTVGGYSYGGYLTNWLITQTKRFNAALSGAGNTDHLSSWGTMDLPIFLSHLFGGYPWEVPHTYQNEAPIYQLDRVRTPTLITTGGSDIRVPASQSYIMERGLHYRGIPVELITFPDEGHDMDNNPWHGKIKVREELKWLQKYGH
jgi:dipeptidyl aminopeptidase/acylaminoacyl peptidase